MRAESKLQHSMIQLSDGSNYGVSESVEKIELLVTDQFIHGDTFITFHFTDGAELKLRKSRISAFYHCEEE